MQVSLVDAGRAKATLRMDVVTAHGTGSGVLGSLTNLMVELVVDSAHKATLADAAACRRMRLLPHPGE
jgi:hypothetical protein